MTFATFFDHLNEDEEFKNYFNQLIKNDGKFDDEINSNESTFERSEEVDECLTEGATSNIWDKLTSKYPQLDDPMKEELTEKCSTDANVNEELVTPESVRMLFGSAAHAMNVAMNAYNKTNMQELDDTEVGTIQDAANILYSISKEREF